MDYQNIWKVSGSSITLPNICFTMKTITKRKKKLTYFFIWKGKDVPFPLCRKNRTNLFFQDYMLLWGLGKLIFCVLFPSSIFFYFNFLSELIFLFIYIDFLNTFLLREEISFLNDIILYRFSEEIRVFKDLLR